MQCQTLADLINEIKRRFDQIPLALLPIPGLDLTKKTTLQCYEYANCNGFNCSGKVYGRDMQFSVSLDYCGNPVVANVSVCEIAHQSFNYIFKKPIIYRCITVIQRFILSCCG